MPEMPEVETVKRILEPQLAGRRIVGLTLNGPDIIAHPKPEAFVSAADGCVIQGMGRRGKFLMLDLAGGSKLVLHLRMTGRPLVTPPELLLPGLSGQRLISPVPYVTVSYPKYVRLSQIILFLQDSFVHRTRAVVSFLERVLRYWYFPLK